MKKMNMSIVQEILEEVMGYECRSYSGRGMFGKSCLGVVTDNPCLLTYRLGVAIGKLVKVVAVGSIKWDSMGSEYIVYFPYIEYCDFFNDDNEEGGEGK